MFYSQQCGIHFYTLRWWPVPCLERLKISDPPEWIEQPRKSALYTYALDTCAPFGSLLGLATLKRVDFERCAEFEPSNRHWDNLRSLSHSRCHSPVCQIPRLVSKCPALECLYLEGTPSMAFDLSCLSGCEKTLQRLELDVWNLVPGSLTKFVGLKVVAISTQSILPNAMARQEHGDPHHGMVTNLAAGAFACTLPSSFEHLYLDFTSTVEGDGWQCQANHLIIDELSKGRVVVATQGQ